MRLDKFLTESLGITRSEAKNLIKKGQIKVDGQTVKDAGMKVDADQNEIKAGDVLCGYEAFHYYMLHKPAGFVTAVTDRRDATVMDLLQEKNKKLFPVGRLDKDTEGLLLITDDGPLAHSLLSPRKHVDKTYLARITEEITPEDIAYFARGVDIGEEKAALPARLEKADPDFAKEGEHYVHITIQEGKFHQVKRMVKAIGKEVLYLKRETMGPLVLDPQLKKGEYRSLYPEEISLLQEKIHG